MRDLTRRAIGCAAALVALGAATLPAAALADTCANTTVRSHTLGLGVRTANDDQLNYTSADTPKATVNGSSITSTITVPAAGKVRSVKVTIDQLTHPADGELTLQLQAPNGEHVLLADHLGGSGANYVGTVFMDAAGSIARPGVTAPFTGNFAPQGDLDTLINDPVTGAWRLEVIDSNTGAAVGTLQKWSLEIIRQPCNAVHASAKLVAEPNPVSPGSQVQLDASGSVGYNSAPIVKYEWDVDGDGGFETNTGATAFLNHTYPSKATVPVGLRVTDVNGNTDQTTITLAVTEIPTALFTVSDMSPLSLTDVTFDAGASTDPDGTIVHYEWDLDGNGTYEVDGGTNPVKVAQFVKSGEIDVHLRVTDDSGATRVATVHVSVQNRPAIADFVVQDAPAIVGSPATLDASSSVDPDGNVNHYEWDLDDNGSYETDGSTVKTTQYTFPASGTYHVSLRITDNGGATSTVRRPIVATKRPVAVVAPSATVVRPNVPVTFNPGGSSDPDAGGSIVKYEWDFDGDGHIDLTTTTPTPVTHTYTTVGTYNATLYVTDDTLPVGAKGVKVVQIQVLNKLPVAVLSASPAPAKTGQLVTFSATGSYDPDGTVVRYQWDLDGNGTYETDTGAVPHATRSYPNAGRVTVRVKVSDNDGAAGLAAASLLITGKSIVQPGGDDPSSAGTASLKLRASLLGASIQKRKTALKKGIGVTCQVDRKATCSLELVVLAKDVKRLKLAKGKKAKKPMKIGKATVKISAKGKKTVKFKFSKKMKKALKKAGKKGAIVVVQGTATDGKTKIKLKRSVLVK